MKRCRWLVSDPSPRSADWYKKGGKDADGFNGRSATVVNHGLVVLESRQKGLSSPIWDLKNGGEIFCFISHEPDFHLSFDMFWYTEPASQVVSEKCERLFPPTTLPHSARVWPQGAAAIGCIGTAIPEIDRVSCLPRYLVTSLLLSDTRTLTGEMVFRWHLIISLPGHMIALWWLIIQFMTRVPPWPARTRVITCYTSHRLAQIRVQRQKSVQ